MQLNNLPLCYEILPPAPLNLLLSIKKENMLWFWERACLVFGNRMLYLTSELAGVFGIFARAFFSSGGVHFSGVWVETEHAIECNQRRFSSVHR